QEGDALVRDQRGPADAGRRRQLESQRRPQRRRAGGRRSGQLAQVLRQQPRRDVRQHRRRSDVRAGDVPFVRAAPPGVRRRRGRLDRDQRRSAPLAGLRVDLHRGDGDERRAPGERRDRGRVRAAGRRGSHLPRRLPGRLGGRRLGDLPLRRRRDDLAAHRRSAAPVRLHQHPGRRSAPAGPRLPRHLRPGDRLRRPANQRYAMMRGPTRMGSRALWLTLLAGGLGVFTLSGCSRICSCQVPPVTPGTGPTAAAAPGGGGLKGSVAYTWKNVVILGGGFVSGIVYSPVEKDLVYARTDVGGAYRWDPAGKSWVALTDQLPRDTNFLGIESLAADPVDANKVYLAAGEYTGSWVGNGAIMRSTDRGNTW